MKKILFVAVMAILQLNGFCQEKSVENNLSGNEKELWIENGDRRIFGIESPAETEGKKGIAIISHGFNGTYNFGRDYFKTLNDLGYSVYVFDFPCGSTRSRSDSNTREMSVMDEMGDLMAIVRHYLKQPDIDSKRVSLIGESQGGLVSALVASEMKDTINNLILIYPALCIPDDWNSRYKTEAEIPEVTDVWGVPVGERYFKEVRNLDVYGKIKRYDGPVQIIHGSKDAVVPLRYSEEAQKQYKDARLKVIPEAGHGFNPEERKISNRTVKDFLEKIN